MEFYDDIDLYAAWERVDLDPKLKKLIERYFKESNIQLIMMSTKEGEIKE